MDKTKKSYGQSRNLSLAYFVWDTSVVDFEQTYREVSAAGVRNIMLDARRGNLDLEKREDAAAARRILSRLGLAAPACHGLYSGDCHLTEEDPATRKIILGRHLGFMANAAGLGAKTYVIHVGFGTWPGPELKRAAWDRVRGALDILAPEAQALEMVLALENGFTADFLIQSAGELVEFVENYGHPAVGICYDSGHANISGGVIPVLETLAPHVVTMHLHDNNGREDQHLVPGEGTIDWRALVPLMARCPRLVHLETEAANSSQWSFTKAVRPAGEIYRRYLKILNRPGSGLACR